MDNIKKIPYGISSYKTIRQKNCYYVDKTAYIPKLENAGEFLFFIRPRRFGKSSFLTVLESYYDIARKDEFDFLFDKTYIKEHPTPEKNSHLILKFNFSQVNPDPEKVEESFCGHARNCFFFFGEKYKEFLDDKYFSMMETHNQPHQQLEFLLDYIGSKGHKVYVLIDEYDNFTNTVLAASGQDKYHDLTHGAGFFRFFFNILKGAADKVDSGISRMFITGVSPVTMDDVTSGFNIGRSMSLHPDFNELLGFSRQDVIKILNYYQTRGMQDIPLDEILNLMQEWYDNYRFSSDAVSTMFNTDMVLYFVKNFLELGKYPENMIDQNVKIDYGKLRHLLIINKRLNGNFMCLEDIISKGSITSNIVDSFPLENIIEKDNFISLLYYFGLLTYKNQNTLHIPNQTVKKLMYNYLRDAYKDVDVFNIDLWDFADRVRSMAYTGNWKPVFNFLAHEIKNQTSIRDFLKGEKVIQTFILAYLNVTDYFTTHSEEETEKGFADLYLEPFLVKYPDIKHRWLIEIKYIKRSQYSESKKEKLVEQAKKQLMKYVGDKKTAMRDSNMKTKCLVLVFSGWEMKETVEVSTAA